MLLKPGNGRLRKRSGIPGNGILKHGMKKKFFFTKTRTRNFTPGKDGKIKKNLK